MGAKFQTDLDLIGIGGVLIICPTNVMRTKNEIWKQNSTPHEILLEEEEESVDAVDVDSIKKLTQVIKQTLSRN